MPGGQIEHRQRAQAVADEGGARNRQGIEQRRQPICNLPHRAESVAGAAAVARSIDREHVAAVMREVARLQRPHAVIVARAVDEDDARPCRVEGATAGVGVDRPPLDVELHG